MYSHDTLLSGYQLYLEVGGEGMPFKAIIQTKVARSKRQTSLGRIRLLLGVRPEINSSESSKTEDGHINCHVTLDVLNQVARNMKTEQL